jgi:hypothetical protein
MGVSVFFGLGINLGGSERSLSLGILRYVVFCVYKH